MRSGTGASAAATSGIEDAYSEAVSNQSTGNTTAEKISAKNYETIATTKTPADAINGERLLYSIGCFTFGIRGGACLERRKKEKP